MDVNKLFAYGVMVGIVLSSLGNWVGKKIVDWNVSKAWIGFIILAIIFIHVYLLLVMSIPLEVLAPTILFFAIVYSNYAGQNKT